MSDDINIGAKPADKLWTAEDLFAYVSEVHSLDVKYRGKTIRVYWKELEASETPDITAHMQKIDPSLSELERNVIMNRTMMHEKAWAMIAKAQRENRDECDVVWSRQQFDRWPDTVKGVVCMELWDLTAKVTSSFPNGLPNPQRP